MSGWDDLTATALLGTARRAVDVTALPGPLGQAAAGLAAGDVARALLDAAALTAPYRRAGTRPQAPPATPGPPAPSDSLQPVGAAAAVRLAGLLPASEASTELLAQWLAGAAAAERRAPADLLPALLDAALRDTAVAAAAVPVLGERGQWLARQRPEWTRVLTAQAASTRSSTTAQRAEADDDETWELGDTLARRAVFAHLRRADPARARELLTASWASQAGEDREAFVDAVAIGLSDADEALLEAALDDRRKGVRERAARLLQQLPSSAYAARMAARLSACVRVERTRLRSRLGVTPPQELDEAALRDGMSPKPPQGTGAGAWRLRELVAATPLPVWTAVTGLPAEKLLALPVDDQWRGHLLAGWFTATCTQGNGTWARALLEARVDAVTQQGRLPELVGTLDPADRAAFVAAHVGDRGARQHLGTLLSSCPSPWPGVLADAVVAWLATTPGHPHDWTTREVLRLCGHRLPVERAGAVSAAAQRLPEDSPWRPALLTVAGTLTFRYEMLEELR